MSLLEVAQKAMSNDDRDQAETLARIGIDEHEWLELFVLVLAAVGGGDRSTSKRLKRVVHDALLIGFCIGLEFQPPPPKPSERPVLRRRRHQLRFEGGEDDQAT